MKTRYTFAILFWLVSFAGLHAQTPTWAWAHAAGSNSYDYATAVAVDSAGNSYVAGYYSVAITLDGSHSYTSAGSSDIIIAKYDPNGQVLWAKSAGGDDADMAKSIAVDADGNVFVVGTFKSASLSFGGPALSNPVNNPNDLFLVKFDTDGNYVWDLWAGSTGDEGALGVAADTAGNCYITGYFTSASMNLGGTTLTNNGAQDVFVAKFSPSGTLAWAHDAVGQGTIYAYGIAVDKFGTSYVVGTFGGYPVTFGTITLNDVANRDLYVLKVNTAGDLIWAKRAGVSADNFAYAVAVDTSLNVFVAGSFGGTTITFGNTTLTRVGNQDMFVVKYNPNGDPLWAKSAGGSLADVAHAVATDQYGYCYVGGSYASTSLTFGSQTLTNAGTTSSDIFISQYLPDGTQGWAKSTTAGAGGESINGIALDTNRNVICAGYIGSTTISFDAIPLTCAGTTDLFISKSGNTPIGMAEVTPDAAGISAYPNPVLANLQLNLKSASVVRLISLQGQVLFTQPMNSGLQEIDLSSFTPGMYFLEVTNPKAQKVLRIVKQ